MSMAVDLVLYIFFQQLINMSMRVYLQVHRKGDGRPRKSKPTKKSIKNSAPQIRTPRISNDAIQYDELIEEDDLDELSEDDDPDDPGDEETPWRLFNALDIGDEKNILQYLPFM